MTEVTKGFCWHQNFVPWGLSVTDLWLYTFIKSWIDVYKIRSEEIFFRDATNDQNDEAFLVAIKILALMGCLPLPKGYVHV